MECQSGIDIAIPVIGHFDFSLLKSIEKDSETGVMELVDVGGGHGVCLKQILDSCPGLDAKKCVLQDRPDVIEMAKARGILPQGLVLMAHDLRT